MSVKQTRSKQIQLGKANIDKWQKLKSQVGWHK